MKKMYEVKTMSPRYNHDGEGNVVPENERIELWLNDMSDKGFMFTAFLGSDTRTGVFLNQSEASRKAMKEMLSQTIAEQTVDGLLNLN